METQEKRRPRKKNASSTGEEYQDQETETIF
jgi:hypothetical protein